MSDAGDGYADFEDPVYLDVEPPSDDESLDKPKPAAIPRLPKPEKPLTDLEMRRGVSNRDKAAVNLKLAGANYQEIAETLEFPSAKDAKRAVERALAVTHTPDEWDTLRLVTQARAEEMFKRSFAMAGADFLVLEDGTKVPNADKLRWHQQAAADLMNHATITGAKAPVKHEITADEEQLAQLVSAMTGHLGVEEVLDAEVLELESLPVDPTDLDGE